jgi:hypothetical protein
MPLSSFVPNNIFWATEAGMMIKHTDFSPIDFTSHLPPVWHGRLILKAKSKNNADD